ncbi:MAG: hypothetical protein COA33_008080 [Fluviicola sp.]|nr:hypothetical protein [Fluviicola sp.]
MTREEYLTFCSVCKNRAFDPKKGIICKITSEVAAFEGNCSNYIVDDREVAIAEQQQQSNKNEVKKEINNGRYALLIIGGLYIIAGFAESFIIEGHDIIFGIIDWGVAAIFIGLGIWSFRKPYIALIIGLSFYIFIIALLAFADPSTILSGIIWKILIIFYLISSIKTAKDQKPKTQIKSDDLLDQV